MDGMRYIDRLKRMEAELYGKKVYANTLRLLKHKMSKVANVYFNVIDEATVKTYCDNREYKFTRINKKAPNNTIERGQWK